MVEVTGAIQQVMVRTRTLHNLIDHTHHLSHATLACWEDRMRPSIFLHD